MMLTDQFQRPLHDLRISVTDRCNFRCPYCMPAEIFHERYEFLSRGELLSFEEIVRLTAIIVGFGAFKVRITGGEPLLRRGIHELIRQVSRIAGVEDLTMTTNAFLLPQHAESLRAAGLQRITISLDSLDEAVFQAMNGVGARVAQVMAGIAAAQAAGFQPIKINCVVQRGVNDHTLVDLARYGIEQGLIVRFIEYMDVGTMNGWRMDDVVPAQEIVSRIHEALPLEPITRNYTAETALRFRYRDGAGEIGVIASVTQPFCGACSRLRLSAKGELFTCLFANTGTDIRSLLRDGSTDEEIRGFLAELWGRREDRYSEIRHELTEPLEDKVEMYHIGG
ncbi:MAG: GTP 3',8-cyclase MoaA [Anaerolineaceae bacterium]|nr:GTP 3',8-cyclase MoaA [Anaerolineaceae bacterium]